MKFKEVIREKYQKMLDGGTAFLTSANKGYDIAFNATETSLSTENASLASLVNTIAWFTE